MQMKTRTMTTATMKRVTIQPLSPVRKDPPNVLNAVMKVAVHPLMPVRQTPAKVMKAVLKVAVVLAGVVTVMMTASWMQVVVQLAVATTTVLKRVVMVLTKKVPLMIKVKTIRRLRQKRGQQCK